MEDGHVISVRGERMEAGRVSGGGPRYLCGGWGVTRSVLRPVEAGSSSVEGVARVKADGELEMREGGHVISGWRMDGGRTRVRCSSSSPGRRL